MWDKAGSEAQAAVDADPDDASLLLDLAAIDREAGHLPEAATALKKAQAVDGRCPEVYYRLGLVSQDLNQAADARAAFTRFIALAPHRLDSEVADAKQRLATLP
jgi:Flp pilus assembly protein TadD